MRKLLSLLLIAIMLTLSACADYVPPPPPEQYDVTIVLDYQHVDWTSNTPMNVYVDDTKLGYQQAGTVETYNISLEEGDYSFYLKNDGIYKTDEIEFTVSPENLTFSFGAKTRLTFGVEVWVDYSA